MTMKRSTVKTYCYFFGLLVCMLSSVLSGCVEQSSSSLDPRFFGTWKQQNSYEIITFNADGTYLVEEGETANWSVVNGNRLEMSGTLYTFVFEEDDTVLVLTFADFSRVFRKQ